MVAYRALTPEIFVQIKFPHPKIIPGGSAKKFNITQIIKTASCFAVIAMVFIASIAMPVNALSNIHYVWDYLTDYYEENGSLMYSFSFQDITSYYTLARSDGGFAEGYPPVSISGDPSTRWIQVHAWPLGVRNWSGAACSGGVIAVSDFERFMSVQLSGSASLQFEYDGTTSGSAYQYEVQSYWLMLYYDSNGSYLGNDKSDTITKTETYTAPITGDTVFAFGCNMALEMPEGTAYFCPMLKSQLNLPSQSADFVYKVYSSFDGFTLSCSASSVMQDTMTLMRIEEEMAELNDKTDLIINGTPEQNQAAQNGANKVQNTEQDIDEMMAQLDEMGEYDTSTAFNTINNFLQSPGWNKVRDLLSPLIDWEFNTTVMLIAAAFATISIILFGR